MHFKYKFLMIFILLFSHTLHAKTQRALLVGVSNYYHLAKDYQLDGPKHDAVIVYKMLRARGFTPENITQLVSSDKKNPASEPTRANILSALTKLAVDSKKDDFVYLHFAGHGSRQPAKEKNNDEADGLDEIFLPADAKKWDSYIGSVENAITDNEIATHIDNIRNKGAHVWVVFDSCHSGSITRGVGQAGVRYRKILGSDLGIPVVRPDNLTVQTPVNAVHSRGHSRKHPAENNFLVKSRGAQSAEQNVNKGSLVTFSAAQSEETTPEMMLPLGESKAQYHGLFTYSLMQVLAKNRGISYQQLAQQVMSLYQNVPWHTTTPLLSAENMNASVFNEAEEAESQWQATRTDKTIKIPAGRLNQLSDGAIVGLYSEATAKKLVAKAVVTKSDAMQSEAKINKEYDVSTLPDSLYVRLLTPVVDFQLAVSVIKTKDQSYRYVEMLENSLKKIAKNHSLLVRKEKDPAKADLFVAMFDNKLWFVNPDQHLPCDIQHGLTQAQFKKCKKERKPERLNFLSFNHTQTPINTERLKQVMQQGLLRIAKAKNLLAIQAALGQQDKQLNMEFLVEEGNSKKPVFKLSPKLKTGDWVNLSIKNTSDKGRDVTVLFIDSQYGIHMAHPRSGEPNVLKPGESIKLRFKVNVDTTGNEHLVVLHSESTGIVQSFNFMQQPPLQVVTRGAKAKAGNSPLQQMMNAARTGLPMSRGLDMGGDEPAPQSGLNVFSWQTLSQ